MHPNVFVLLPLDRGCHEEFVSHSCCLDILSDFQVVVTKSGNSASLPVEMTLIETVVDGDEEEQSINNEGPLVGIPPHGRVASLYHILIIITYPRGFGVLGFWGFEVLK